jgi:hypothetical protein
MTHLSLLAVRSGIQSVPNYTCRDSANCARLKLYRATTLRLKLGCGDDCCRVQL